VVLPEFTLDQAGDVWLPAIRAITRYAGPVRAAILAGKERGRADLPPLLGAAVGRALLRLHTIAVLPDPLWIVPAPSRRAAARARGGDPVTAMATAAAQLVAAQGLACGVAPCLYTSGRARDSIGMDASGRAANLLGRIRFRSRGTPPDGVAVVLLDDVITSGSTLVASLRVLDAAGIAVSSFLAVATAAPWRTERTN